MCCSMASSCPALRRERGTVRADTRMGEEVAFRPDEYLELFVRVLELIRLEGQIGSARGRHPVPIPSGAQLAGAVLNGAGQRMVAFHLGALARPPSLYLAAGCCWLTRPPRPDLHDCPLFGKPLAPFASGSQPSQFRCLPRALFPVPVPRPFPVLAFFVLSILTTLPFLCLATIHSTFVIFNLTYVRIRQRGSSNCSLAAAVCSIPLPSLPSPPFPVRVSMLLPLACSLRPPTGLPFLPTTVPVVLTRPDLTDNLPAPSSFRLPLHI